MKIIFKKDLTNIYKNERGILILMIFNFLFAIALLVFSLMNLNPESSVVKIGYGDIGGYRDGSWTNLLAFSILAIIFGLFHNVIALRMFHKRGGGMTKFFLVTTTALIAGTWLVLVRLLGEG